VAYGRAAAGRGGMRDKPQPRRQLARQRRAEAQARTRTCSAYASVCGLLLWIFW
jgi:hypothetical protein